RPDFAGHRAGTFAETLAGLVADGAGDDEDKLLRSLSRGEAEDLVDDGGGFRRRETRIALALKDDALAVPEGENVAALVGSGNTLVLDGVVALSPHEGVAEALEVLGGEPLEWKRMSAAGGGWAIGGHGRRGRVQQDFIGSEGCHPRVVSSRSRSAARDRDEPVAVRRERRRDHHETRPFHGERGPV